jgi:ABC-2 type transport system permease protein
MKAPGGAVIAPSSKYFLFFINAFKSQVVYRLSTLISLLTSALLLFIRINLWNTLIGTGLRSDTTMQDMIAWIVITEAVYALTRGEFANELGLSIREGSVIMHLLRPVSYRLYLLSSYLGKNCYQFFAAALPVLAVSSVITGFPLPASVPHLLFFLVLTFLGILIMFELIYIFGLLAFWTQKTWYLSWYVRAGFAFFGGGEIPLWLYPNALERLTLWLPFRYISFEGINYYLGRLPAEQGGRSIAIAFLWWVILFGIGKILWFKAAKKLTVNGG